METDRSAEDIQREIEQARASLASTVDELAVRTSPKRIISDTKQKLIAQAQSPRGKAVLGGTAAVVALLLVVRVRSVRRRRRSAD